MDGMKSPALWDVTCNEVNSSCLSTFLGISKIDWDISQIETGNNLPLGHSVEKAFQTD